MPKSEIPIPSGPRETNTRIDNSFRSVPRGYHLSSLRELEAGPSSVWEAHYYCIFNDLVHSTVGEWRPYYSTDHFADVATSEKWCGLSVPRRKTRAVNDVRNGNSHLLT